MPEPKSARVTLSIACVSFSQTVTRKLNCFLGKILGGKWIKFQIHWRKHVIRQTLH